MELQKLHAKNTKRTDEVGRTQLADEMTPKRRYDTQVPTINQVKRGDGGIYKEKFISLIKHQQIVNKLCSL